MSEEEVKPEKKGGKGLLIAIIGILVVLIIVIVVVVILLLGGDNKAETTETGTTPAPIENTQPKNTRSDYAKPGPIFVIPEAFVVNLMGQNGRRYAKTSVALEMSTPDLQKEITTKIPLIKDTIIRVISSKTFEEISTPKGKDKLKEEITQELNAFMVDGYIKSVFFTEFVIQ